MWFSSLEIYGTEIHVHENAWPGLYSIISAMKKLLMLMFAVSAAFIILSVTLCAKRTLADEVEYQMSEEGIEPSGKEGHNGSNWIVLDYSDVIVHVFYKETREFYQLERLWADGEHLDVEELLK